MEAWQNRVIEEKTALDEKIVKLRAFVDTEGFFERVEAEDRTLLYTQLGAMQSYSLVLGHRIARLK